MADAMELIRRRKAEQAQKTAGAPAPTPTPVRAAAAPSPTPSLVVPEGFILVRQTEIDGLNRAVSQAVAACGEVKADLDRLRPEWEADKAELAKLREELAHLRVQGGAPVDAASEDAPAVAGAGDDELWSEAVAEIERLTLQIAELEAQIGTGAAPTDAVADLEAQVAAGAARIAELEAHVAAMEAAPVPAAGSDDGDLLDEAAAEIGRLTDELSGRDDQVIYLNARVVELEADVERLTASAAGTAEPEPEPEGFERWQGPGDILDLKVDDVPDWGGRTKNCLRNAKIVTIRELLTWKRGGKGGRVNQHLMSIKNFGEKCITEVEGWLAAQGLALAADPPEPVGVSEDDDFLPEAEPLADGEVDPTEAELPPEPGEPVVPKVPPVTPVHDVSTNGVDTAESAFAAQLAQLFG